jgi:hypothetical protein
MCREAKWITQARLPHFHSSGKSELLLDRDLLCVTTVGISYEVYQETVTENLNMHPIAVKFVHRLLTNDRSL